MNSKDVNTTVILRNKFIKTLILIWTDGPAGKVTGCTSLMT